MNHHIAAKRLAELILDMTDPELPRYRKEQIEIMARNAAMNYMTKEAVSNGKC